jgi:hypothetical protein
MHQRLTIHFLLLLTLLASCGGNSSDSNSSNAAVIGDDSLLEVGPIPLEEEQNENFTVNDACDVFNDTRHSLGEYYQQMFVKNYQKCDRLSERRANALMASSSFANALFSELNENADSSTCVSLGKRAIRKVVHLNIRDAKIFADHKKSELFSMRNSVTNARLSKIVRSLYHKGCVDSPLDGVSYVFNGENIVFTPTQDHIINGSFELFKNINDEQKGTSYLEDGWTIVESSNVPGWRIREVYESGESKVCANLEIQKSGVVTQAADGNQLVELDSHCKDATSGRNVSGDANVDIYQRFAVSSTGVYSLRMKAQKRAGSYGNLAVSIHQSASQASYEDHVLSDTAEWSEVCQEIDISNTSKRVTISIRDNGNDGRQTYGVLLDQVEFVAGSCD